jgi:nitrite reductase/ring-hydroxylating ferredoxin subunit
MEGAQGKWHRAISISELEEDDVVGVVVGEQGEHEVAVYKLGGKYYATADRCTHQSARLSDGLVIDDFIECPLHQGRFNIATGKARSAPVSVPLKTFPTKVLGEAVYVFIEDIQFD